VFADCDGSGDLSGGDVGLTNAMVTLLDANSNTVSMAVTSSDGAYCFYNLPPGTYTVVVTPPDGYTQTGGTCVPHWRDSWGRDCWKDNDSRIHWKDSYGKDCWKGSDGYHHWKDSYGRNCWKDWWGNFHWKYCDFKGCDDKKDNTETYTLGPCESKTGINFAYTGTKTKAEVCVWGPSKGKCGDWGTYTCTVTNTGNVCFTKGCQIKICDEWFSCPKLEPGQGCKFEKKYCFKSSDCGTFYCQSSANCYTPKGDCYTVKSYCKTDVSSSWSWNSWGGGWCWW
jgi:hypothetical protein